MSALRHGVNAIGLDGLDGQHDRGTTNLTRIDCLGGTRVARAAADAKIARIIG